MRTSRFLALVGTAVVLFAVGVLVLSPNTKRTRVPMPDGSTVTILDGSCFVEDNRIAFSLFCGSGAFCIAAILYQIIPRRRQM